MKYVYQIIEKSESDFFSNNDDEDLSLCATFDKAVQISNELLKLALEYKEENFDDKLSCHTKFNKEKEIYSSHIETVKEKEEVYNITIKKIEIIY